MSSEISIIGKSIRLKRPPVVKASWEKPGTCPALMRCFRCQQLREASHGWRGVVVAGTSEYPFRVKCHDCGRHLGWLPQKSEKLLKAAARDFAMSEARKAARKEAA